MDWIEVTVTVTPEAVEAVGHILMEAGAGGVVETARGVRTAYLPADEHGAQRVDRIAKAVADLARFGLDPGPAAVTYRKVGEEAWAHAWKEHFHPVRVSPRIVVRPTWRDYAPHQGEIVLDLDPGMAFGTGTHATTRLCLQALDRRVAEGSVVFDVGTGSGILAIAAAKLGSARVVACDTDPVAVRVAKENVHRNGVDACVEVIEGSWPQLIEEGRRADVLVANILASVIEAMIPDVPALLNPGGCLIASGIAAFRRSGVVAAFRRHRWHIEGEYEDEEWVAFEARPPGEPST